MMQSFLTIPEEITLLSIDDNEGGAPQSKTFDVVLASAVLADLALRQRIDTDDKKMILVSNHETGDLVLDEILQTVYNRKGEYDPAWWIGQIAVRADEILEMIISSLIVKKVIKVENQKVLWVFSSRRYPVTGDKEIQEVRSRLRELVFGSEIPDLRDIVLMSLCHYGGLHSLLFSDEEARKYQERIEQIARMDLIGQAIAKALNEISLASRIVEKTKIVFGSKTPEQMLEEQVELMKHKFRIRNDSDLPDWLRKGTAQYIQTLKFVEEKKTADIYYNFRDKKYYLKQYRVSTHLFGSGAK